MGDHPKKGIYNPFNSLTRSSARSRSRTPPLQKSPHHEYLELASYSSYPLSAHSTILLVHHPSIDRDTKISLLVKNILESSDEAQGKGWQIEIVNSSLIPNSNKTLKKSLAYGITKDGNLEFGASATGPYGRPPTGVVTLGRSFSHESNAVKTKNSPRKVRSKSDLTDSISVDGGRFVAGCRAILYLISQEALDDIEEVTNSQNHNLLLDQISQGLDLADSNIDVILIPLLIGTTSIESQTRRTHFNRFRRFDCERYIDTVFSLNKKGPKRNASPSLHSSTSSKNSNLTWTRRTDMKTPRQLMRRFFQLGHVDINPLDLSEAVPTLAKSLSDHINATEFPPSNYTFMTTQSIFNYPFDPSIYIEQLGIWSSIDTAFASGNVCIVIGSPSSGKTFAAVEYIQRKVESILSFEPDTANSTRIANLETDADSIIPAPGCHPALYLHADTEERLREGWLAFCQHVLHAPGGVNRFDADPSIPTLTLDLSTQSLNVIINRLAPLLNRRSNYPLLPAYVLLDKVVSWTFVKPLIEAFPTIKFLLTTSNQMVVETAANSVTRTGQVKKTMSIHLPPSIVTMGLPTEREVFDYVQKAFIGGSKGNFTFDDVRRIIQTSSRAPIRISTAVRQLTCRLECAGILVLAEPNHPVTVAEYEAALATVKLQPQLSKFKNSGDRKASIPGKLFNETRNDTPPEISLGLRALSEYAPITYEFFLSCSYFDDEIIFVDRIAEFFVIHSDDDPFELLSLPEFSTFSQVKKLSTAAQCVRAHFYLIANLGLCQFLAKNMLTFNQAVKRELRNQAELLNPSPKRKEFPNERMRLLTLYHDDLRTPLHIAVADGNAKMVKNIVAKAKIPDSFINIDAYNINLATPLYDAIARNHPEICQILLEAEADPRVIVLPYRLNGGSLLHHAVRSANRKTCELLLQYGVNIEILDRQGKSALDIAADANMQEIIGLLLNYDVKSGGEHEHFVVSLVRAETKTRFRSLRRKTRYPSSEAVDSNLDKSFGELKLDSPAGSKKTNRMSSKVASNVSTWSTDLHRAAKMGSWSLCEKALKNNVDWKARNRSGCMALHIAWGAGHFALYHKLLDYGILIGLVTIEEAFKNLWNNGPRSPRPVSGNVSDIPALPPLHLAGATSLPVVEITTRLSQSSSLTALHNLLMFVQLRDANGATPLHHAAATGHEGMIQWLFDMCKGNLDLDTVDFDGRTPFLVAVCCNQPNACNLLLDLNSQALGIPDASGRTPLYHAVSHGHKQLTKSLISWIMAVDEVHGSKILQKCLTASVSEDGRTPLYACAVSGDVETAETLLRNGAMSTIDTPDGNGETPLFTAVFHGNAAFVKFLLMNKSKAINTVKPGNFWTPLMCAAVNGYTEIVKILVEHKCKIDETDLEGRTPLFAAVIMGHLDVVKCLLLKGSKGLRISDNEGRFPLFCATMTGRADILATILSYDTYTIDSHDNEGILPITIAAFYGYVPIIELLLGYGSKCMDTQFASSTADNPSDINLAIEGISSGATPFFAAASNGKAEVLEFLLLQGSKALEIPDTKFRRPIHAAAQNGSVTTIKVLLKAGAVPNPKDIYGRTPFFVAIEHSWTTIADYLVKNCGELGGLDEPDNNGVTPLLNAISKGDTDTFQHLMTLGTTAVDTPDETGWTPILAATSLQQFAVIKTLLINGACQTYNQPSNDGTTPLYLAGLSGNLELVQEFLNHDPSLIHSRFTENEITLLHVAVLNQNFELVKYIIEFWKDLMDIPDKNGNTPFFNAALNGNLEILDYLYEFGSDALDIRTNSWVSPLHVACFNGHFDVVMAIMEMGTAMLDELDATGTTPLFNAAFNGHAAIIQYLIDNGSISLDRPNNDAITPFYIACANNHHTAAKLILENGSEALDMFDNSSNTPLHIAASFGNNSIIDLLFEYGSISLDAANDDGITPLYFAAQNGHASTIEKLLAKSSLSIAVPDNENQTPLLVAAENGHSETVLYLLNKGCGKLDDSNINGETAVFLACKNGFADVLQILLDHGSDALNTPDNDGVLPLYTAVQEGHVDVVRKILEHQDTIAQVPDTVIDELYFKSIVGGHLELTKYFIGVVRVNLLFMEGRSGIHLAALYGYEDLVELFIESGGPELLKTKDFDQNTPLHLASLGGFANVCNAILHHGNPLELIAMENKFRETPTDLAVINGKVEVIEFYVQCSLISNFTSIHKDALSGVIPILPGKKLTTLAIEARTDRSYTALHFAVVCGHAEVCKNLLEVGQADMNHQSASGYAPLHLAAKIGNLEICQLLILHRAVLDVKSEFKFTPLHVACEKGHIEVCKLLIERKANVNVADAEGNLPIMKSVEGGLAVLTYMAGLPGAKLNVRNQNEEGLLHLACRKGDVEVLIYLIEAGLPVNIVDRNMKTPMDLVWDDNLHMVLQSAGGVSGKSAGKLGREATGRK